MLLSAEKLSLNFGVKPILDEVNLYLNEGDKIGVIGVNGTGKSTLLRILAGETEPDSGRVTRDPNVRVSFLSQHTELQDELTVLEQVFVSMPKEFRELEEYEAQSMLMKLGIPDFARKTGTLSGGQKKRVALAAALIQPSDVLILDEPTNHLDAEMTVWLEERIKSFRGGVIMVTHDRYFLERAANHIIEVSHAKLYHYEANYSGYLALKAERAEMAQASERKRQAILRTEREWIMRGCRARSTKSRDRIERYEELKGREAPEEEESVKLSAGFSRLGKKLISLEGVSKSFGGRTVIRDFSYTLKRGDRIGIVGMNGAGKTTLLRLIAGELAPDRGSVDIGSTVKPGFFSQEGRELDLTQRVYDFIHEAGAELRTGDGVFTAKTMMERFLFPPELQSVPIGRLSGGERRRLYLLSILMSAPNVLLLDEPTNDLDIMTLSILEDYLDSFEGPVITVSHDRFLLDRLAEQIFEVRDGEVLVTSGNWSDWQRKRTEEEIPSQKKQKEAGERPRSPRKLKFTFKEQREYETIDAEIAALEAELRKCGEEQLKYGSDYVKLQELTEEQQRLEAALDEKTERWLYLQEKKEQIDSEG